MVDSKRLIHAIEEVAQEGVPDLEEMLPNFGARVRGLRDREHLTQEQFCERYHLPLSRLLMWEESTSTRAPDYTALLLIKMIDADPVRTADIIRKARNLQD